MLITNQGRQDTLALNEEQENKENFESKKKVRVSFYCSRSMQLLFSLATERQK